jgi:tRNA A-37 threonylcarbamoyl transferase component Bud32
MSTKEEMDSISVTQIHAGEDDGGEIIFEFNGKHIAVSVFPGRLSPDVERHLIGLFSKATSDDLGDEYDDLVDEILDVILDAGRAIFRRVAPSPAPNPSGEDLHSLLYPETLHFRLQSVGNKPTIVSINSNDSYATEAQFDQEVDSDLQIDSELPQYSSQQIQVLETFVGSGAVSRVLVQGQEMLCKARKSGLLDQNLERELFSLQTIKASSRESKPIRTPQLIAYVKHAGNGHIIGLLREWIPSGVLGGSLKAVCTSTAGKERKEKWAAQIRETVNQLHEMGIVWGDGKPSNVIIDSNDNAWLIDLAGGWTDGWVGEEIADTVEGDEQAVRNIFEFLGVEAKVN